MVNQPSDDRGRAVQVPCCAATTSAGVRSLGDAGRILLYGGKDWAIEDALQLTKRQLVEIADSQTVATPVSGMPSSKLSVAK